MCELVSPNNATQTGSIGQCLKSTEYVVPIGFAPLLILVIPPLRFRQLRLPPFGGAGPPRESSDFIARCQGIGRQGSLGVQREV